jgi:hypothetical protein
MVSPIFKNADLDISFSWNFSGIAFLYGRVGFMRGTCPQDERNRIWYFEENLVYGLSRRVLPSRHALTDER